MNVLTGFIRNNLVSFLHSPWFESRLLVDSSHFLSLFLVFPLELHLHYRTNFLSYHLIYSMIRFVLTFCHLKFPTSFSLVQISQSSETFGYKHAWFVNIQISIHICKDRTSCWLRNSKSLKHFPDSLESVPYLQSSHSAIGMCTAAKNAPFPYCIQYPSSRRNR